MDPETPPINQENSCETVGPALPALPSAPARPPLVPERGDFLDGAAPAAEEVAAFLTRALEATGGEAPAITAALVPWGCDALHSNHSVKAYHRDLTDFFRHMQALGLTPLEVTADHVKLYKRALAEGRGGGTGTHLGEKGGIVPPGRLTSVGWVRALFPAESS